jgi:hypothetical protein
MKRIQVILIIIAVIFTTGFSFRTNSFFTLIKSIEISGDYISSDNLGNIYLVDDHKLIKYDDNGNLLFTYSSLIDGNISAIDVSDPMKILLFYKDFGRIKFLDNKLSVKGDYVGLQDLSLEQASLACLSYENSFWVYDPLSIKIYRIDQNLQINQSSSNISQLTGNSFNPCYMAEYNNLLYVTDTAAGVFIFDRYAGLTKTIPIKNIHFFQIINEKIAYSKSGKLKTFGLKTYEESTTQIPDNDNICVRVEQNKLYVLTNKKLNIYKFNQ